MARPPLRGGEYPELNFSPIYPAFIDRRYSCAISNFVSSSREGFQPIHLLSPEQAQRECRLIVIERFAEVRVIAAGLAVGRAGDGSEFGKHYTRPLLGREANRSFHVLLFGVGVSDDDVRGNQASACLAQCPYGIRKFLRVHLAACFALPRVCTGLESQEESLETCAHHEARVLGRDEARVERVGCVKRQT